MTEPLKINITAYGKGALEGLLEFSRRSDLKKLAGTFAGDSSIKRDEFVRAMTIDNQYRKVTETEAGRAFDLIVKRFGDTLTEKEIVPFWQMVAEGIGLPDDLHSKIGRLTWIPVATKPIGPEDSQVGTMEIWRTTVPKGSKLSGLDLNDGDKGAWRPVHRIFGKMTLDTEHLKITAEELALIISRVDLYPKGLTRSRSGNRMTTPRDLSCPDLFYSTIDIPSYLFCDGYDVICMPAPNRREDGAYFMEWTTRMPTTEGAIKNLNDLAPDTHPDCEGDTWGSWYIREKKGKIEIFYNAVLDLPGVIGSNLGTGNSILTPDSMANRVMTSATVELMDDVVRFGTVYEVVKRGRILNNQPLDFKTVMGEVAQIYDKELPLSENLARVGRKYPQVLSSPEIKNSE